MDENLFYKGVDKTKVHGARLHQSYSPSDSVSSQISSAERVLSGNNIDPAMDNQHPPYPFDSGNSLLALTKKHNVGFIAPDDTISPL